MRSRHASRETAPVDCTLRVGLECDCFEEPEDPREPWPEWRLENEEPHSDRMHRETGGTKEDEDA